MDITLNRGEIYYCKNVLLPASKNKKETFRNKYILILQGGNFFKKTDRVNIVIGTSQKVDNPYPTDVVVDPADVIPFSEKYILTEKTKFNCAEIYLFRKVEILQAKKVCLVKDYKMREIDIALIKSLCIKL
jgi:mRNA-degrading endonuclease toxin of MazEF toxin-antitoxin module